jgi:hypothetical protein
MAKEMEAENPFSTLFKGKEPKQKQIAWAVTMLRQVLERPENPALCQEWAKLLTPFHSDQLAAAFNAVALTSKGWPTLGDITEPILEAEYAADMRWLMSNLRLHGADWGYIPATYGPDYRKPGAGIDEWEHGPKLSAAIPPPEIPARIWAALEMVGAGVKAEGMRFVARHPSAGGVLISSEDAAKAKYQVEKEFRAAWMAVRRRELGGGL